MLVPDLQKENEVISLSSELHMHNQYQILTYST